MSNSLATTDKQPLVPIDEDELDYLRADNILTAINANLPPGGRPLKPIPTGVKFYQRDRQVVQNALHVAFQLTGGVPALVKFAEDHPKEFYALWGRLLPQENTTPGGTNIIFQSAVPPSPLDLVSIRPNGEVFLAQTTDDEAPE